MTETFKQRWDRVVREKQTTIVAGLDPQNLPVGTNILVWCMTYIKEVEKNVAGIKVNPKYFFKIVGEPNGLEILKLIGEYCKTNNLVGIFDEKLSDVEHTNEAGADAANILGYDSVTIAPYAGNGNEITEYCNRKEFGVFNMGLMSSKKFIEEGKKYVNKETEVPMWKDRVLESLESGVDGLVLGGTFKEGEKYLEEFCEFLEITKSSNCLYLCPGFGAQGGDVEKFLEMIVNKFKIDPRRFQLNFGRDLMNASDREKESERLKSIFQKWQSEYDRLKKLEENDEVERNRFSEGGFKLK